MKLIKIKIQKYITILCIPILIIFVGISLNYWKILQPLKYAIHERTITSSMLNSVKTGEILLQLGLLNVVPNDYSQHGETKNDQYNIREKVFKRKNRIGIQLYTLDEMQIAPEKTPSSTIIDKNEISTGMPLMSIVIDNNDIEDLLNNILKRGRKWERPVYMSFFNNGKLLTASGAGLRIHGGKSRIYADPKSFRLYFRNIYGADQFMPGILFDESSVPLRHLIVHNDIRVDKLGRSWHFTNPIAYDIAKQIGCITPQTQPVRFFLNGELQGVYVLKEHLSPEYLLSHYGHDSFILLRTKQDYNKNQSSGWFKSGNRRVYEEFLGWSKSAKAPLTKAEVGEKVDIENFLSWYIAILYCATTDAFQGALVKDESRSGSKWFWINWDMDHSFMDFYQTAENPWEHDTFAYVLNKDDERIRVVLLKRLLLEDPEFRYYFRNLFVAILNHKLKQEFLYSRLNHYEKIAIAYGIQDRGFINRVRQFFTYRHTYLRKYIKTYLNAGESYSCQVIGPKNALFEIDGYQEKPGYTGWYHEGMSIKIKIKNPYNRNFSHWLINGEQVNTIEAFLTYPVKSKTIIEPIFTKN